MRLCVGYEVVCADGVVRCLPYHNDGDALCDASVYDEQGTCDVYALAAPRRLALPPCPGGHHKVRLQTFAHATSAKAEA